MTPDLGIENAKKVIIWNAEGMTRADALVYFFRLRMLIDSLEGKVAKGEPIKRKAKTVQG